MRRSGALEICRCLLILYVWAHPLMSRYPMRTGFVNDHDRYRQANLLRIRFDLFSNKFVDTRCGAPFFKEVRRSSKEGGGLGILLQYVVDKALATFRMVNVGIRYNENFLATGLYVKRANAEFGCLALNPYESRIQALPLAAFVKLVRGLQSHSLQARFEWLTRQLLKSVGYRSYVASTHGSLPDKVRGIEATGVGSKSTNADENALGLKYLTHRQRGFLVAQN